MSNHYLVSADVVERIVELLREHGDKLNEEVSHMSSFSFTNPADILGGLKYMNHKFKSNNIRIKCYIIK